MDALNKNSKAAAEEKPKARFRTRDISIRKIYSNDRNFYSMPGIEQLAQEILAVGLMENMTVAYAPCERGEYKIIAGERRWRALNLLLEKGYEDFETVTCQIKSAAEENEEMVQLIIANAYRDKTIADMLEEEKRLKESLQYMKDETYFHYTDDGMEIGKKQDGGVLPFSTLLSDKRLEFRQEGVPVAYVQYNKLHIENVEAVRRWSVGAADDGGYFDFISTQYGMGVKWREAEQVEETATQSVKRKKQKQEYKQLIDDDGIFEVVKV